MNFPGGKKNSAPLSMHMMFSISPSRLFAPTPPTSMASFFSAWAMALSVTSTSMAKAVSCRL
ncbi:Uncharacterised protein [uncultured archaeon]|nr:Uncharacterised protein [uncultured archaeon]